MHQNPDEVAVIAVGVDPQVPLTAEQLLVLTTAAYSVPLCNCVSMAGKAVAPTVDLTYAVIVHGAVIPEPTNCVT